MRLTKTQVAIAFAMLIGEGIIHMLWYCLPLYWLEQMWAMRRKDGILEDPDLERNFEEMVNTKKGYFAEIHHVTTPDGFVLGIHRIIPTKPRSENNKRESKGVVFFQHGFMQNSEAWIARGPKNSLPYMMVDRGYDVWLGNNRGNKYSYKHLRYLPTTDEFWNFCIDDLANLDLPTMINYVLKTTGVESITYIGFSQGTAQAFAAFSTNPDLASKINTFVALAPATRVNQLRNPLVAALTTSRPKLVFLLFGKKALLSDTLFWRRVLSWPVFVAVIDWFLAFLFGWSAANIDPKDKAMVYGHLYSYGSVKTLVHWFQITSSKRFQVFDDNITVMNQQQYKNYELPCYEPSKITCPMVVFWGGKDTVPDMDWLLSQLPEDTIVHKEDTYEHLDFLWASSVATSVFPQVIEDIENIKKRPPTKRTVSPKYYSHKN